ncbi:methyltransferase [Candidatus Sumerlaeota bacterium]|nr:methyltransferase [Candidatus Sumerlaeota bacterium]
MSAKAKRELLEMTGGFWRAIPVITAQRLGLFARIAKAPKTPAQLRRALAAEERALRRLLDALLGLGLIVWEDDHLALAPKFAPYLDPASPEALTGMLDHQWHLIHSWMRLERIVLDGAERVVDFEAMRADPERERAFNHAMRTRGRESAQELMRAFDFRKVRRVLDVGGGSGAIAAEVCRRHRRLEWTILDRPGALSLARRKLAADGLTDRIRCVRGDAVKDVWPEGHDAVLLSNLIHAYGEGDTDRILRRAAAALPRGGRLLLRDFISPREDVPTPFAGIFGINMLVNTERGRVYSLPELKRMVQAAGFRFERFVDDQSQTLIARRR